jgi:uncharacterized membrane protein
MKRIVKSVWGRLVGCFLAGLFTILPLVITIVVITWVAEFILGIIGPDKWLGTPLSALGKGVSGKEGELAYFLGCVIVLAAIFLLGVMVQMGMRRLLHRLVAPVIKSIPIAGSVYGAASQIVGLLEKRDDTDLKGMSVVYCVFGKENGTGLLALLPTTDRYPIDGRDYHIVYIPTAPIPMTGGLLFVPVDSVRTVDMSVESLMSIYLSMGVTGPEFLTEQTRNSQTNTAGST